MLGGGAGSEAFQSHALDQTADGVARRHVTSREPGDPFERLLLQCQPFLLVTLVHIVERLYLGVPVLLARRTFDVDESVLPVKGAGPPLERASARGSTEPDHGRITMESLGERIDAAFRTHSYVLIECPPMSRTLVQGAPPVEYARTI